MTEEYRVPKFQLPVRLLTTEGVELEVRLHLGERSEHRAGPERPSDLLNGGEPFLPVSEPEGGTWLLAHSAALVVTVPAAAEGTPADGEAERREWVRRETVRLVLENGRELGGVVSFVPPPGRPRLLDHLNGSEEFLAVRDGDRIHLVNKRRIARVLAP